MELEAVARRARFSGEIGNAIIADTALPITLQQCSQAAVDHLNAAFARVWPSITASLRWCSLRAPGATHT